jgi:catechol 2,3-dioxygenase-like lactoylglutathione lyase family enzyme
VTLQHAAIETHPRDADALVAFFALLGFGEVVPPSGHVAVVAPDYEATVAALRAAGHEVADRAQHWGAPRAFATAPGGHRVELMAAPPD